MAGELFIIGIIFLVLLLVLRWVFGAGLPPKETEEEQKKRHAMEVEDEANRIAYKKAMRAGDEEEAERLKDMILAREKSMPPKRDEATEGFARLMHTGLTYLVVIVAALLVVGFFVNVITFIPAGSVGVRDLFGAIQPTELQAGVNLKNPLEDVHLMNVRTTTYSLVPGGDYPADVLTKEGLTVTMDMTVLYHILPDRADGIYKDLGPSYDEIVVKPQVRTAIRDIIATYDAKALYSVERTEISDKVFVELQPQFTNRGIVLESVLLRRIILPEQLTTAIEAKLTAEQQIAQKEFDVQKQQKEADRIRTEAQGIADKMRIEAQGKADANNILAQSITDPILRYYWIEAIRAKTGGDLVYIPVGTDGMPIVKTV